MVSSCYIIGTDVRAAQLDSALFQSFHLTQVPSLVMFPIGWDPTKGPTMYAACASLFIELNVFWTRYQQAYGMRADPIVQFALDYAGMLAENNGYSRLTALPTPTSTPDANGRMRDQIRTNLQRVLDYLPVLV
jgi:hypothetical protein